MPKTLMELTGDTAAAAWIPTEAWADLILEASVCEGQLSGVITAVDYDVAAGNGQDVHVRAFPTRTAQGPLTGGCECLSATSSTLVEYNIQIRQWGDYDQMCDFTLWKAKGPVKEGILNEMARGFASARDTYIWTAITAFTPSVVSSTITQCASSTAPNSESTYCCTGAYRKSLYNSIVSVTQQLRSNCKNPDYVILDPTVAKYFYMMDYAEMPSFGVQFVNGKLTMLNGLKVIETGVATNCNSTSGATMVVVLDSTRAVGEAWGKHPTFYEDFVPDCNYYKEVFWAYWGCGAMDTTAIGHVINP